MKKKKASAKAAKKTKARKVVKTKAKAKKPAAKAKKSGKAKRAKKGAAAPPKRGVIPPVNGLLLGFVDDYFAKIGVIALNLKGSVAVGQKIQVLGHTTNFEQTVDSMQINHAAVQQASSGDSVGIKVNDRARNGDHVYLLK